MVSQYNDASIFAAGKALVPDYAEQELRRRLADMQIQNGAIARQQAVQEMAINQRKIDKDNAFQGDVDQVLLNPTPEAISSLILKHPDYQKEVSAAWEMRDKAARTVDLRQMGEIWAAGSNGRFDVAAKLARQRYEADKEAGQADESDLAIVTALESNDPTQQRAALGMIGVNLAGITGPDKFASTLGATSDADQTKDFTLSPGQQRRSGITNEIIASAPFAPRPVTVGAGDTVIEYNPGGGDPASSGGAGGSLFDRVLQAEGGTDADGNFLTSPKGAVGPAQVMPATAPEAAALAGVPFNDKLFRTNAAYNMRLGNAYLSAQLQKYGGNEALAAAAYNAGPGAVDRALDKGGPQGWINHVPAETRDYVAKVTGGSTGGATGGPRVIAQGATKPTPQKMTTEEIAAEGLDPTKVYYRDVDGTPKAVGDKPATGPAKLTEQQAKDGLSARRMANASTVLNRLESNKDFNPNLAGVGSKITKFTGGLINNKFSRQYQAAKGEWIDSIIRLTTGAAATEYEMNQSDTTYFPQIGDDASVVAQKRQMREEAMRGAFQRAGPGAPPSAPIKVRSVQEAMRLAPGTVFITPDGRRKVR